MATNPFKRISVPTAVDSSNKFDLSYNHMTTLSYFQPCVAMFHESVPGESFKLDQRIFTRLAPLVKPMIADVRIKTATFYVPYRTVFAGWTDFLADIPFRNGSVTNFRSVPYVMESVLRELITVYSSHVGASATHYDFKHPDGTYYLFGRYAELIYSVLLGLGYNFSLETNSNEKLSALPILAYFKVWNDWLRNSSFVQDIYLEIEAAFKNQVLTALTYSELYRWFSLYGYYIYDKDYFTSATVYPNGSNDLEMMQGFEIPDPQNPELFADLAANQVKGFYASVSTTDSDAYDLLTKYTLDGMLALSDFAKRKQLSGIQPFLRILTEYGVALPDAVVNRSIFLGSDEVNIDIADVTSSSYADDTTLGEQGGRGVGLGNKVYSYKTDEFGAFITIAFVVPKLSYVEGMKKHCMRVNRTDFYTPEFEQLGYEPLSAKELHRDIASNQIFGFTPRYASYKCATDVLSGAPFFRSQREFFEGWFNYRKVDKNDRFITPEFCMASSLDVPRNFATDSQFDTFVVIFRNNINSILPMHKLYDEYKFSNYDEHPRQVNIPNQGLTVN